MTDELIPVVQTIDFHGSKLQTFEAEGERWVALRPVIEAMGLNVNSQLGKLSYQRSRFSCRDIATTGRDGKRYQMLCVPLRKYPAWLNAINAARVKDEKVRERVVLFQELSTEALYQFWTTGQATMESVGEAVREQGTAIDLAPVLEITRTESAHTRNAFWCGFNKQVTPRFTKLEDMVVTLTRWLGGRLKTLWEGINEIQMQNAEVRADLLDVQRELTTMRDGVEMMAHQMAETNRTNARLVETLLKLTVDGR